MGGEVEVYRRWDILRNFERIIINIINIKLNNIDDDKGRYRIDRG